MQVKLMSDGCDGGNCPKVYETDRQTVLVQGYNLDTARPDGVTLGEGESVVEIPKAVWQDAVANFAKASNGS